MAPKKNQSKTIPEVIIPQIQEKTLTEILPLEEELHFETEDKILAEIWSQQIFTQKCSDSILCPYIPTKNQEQPILKYVNFNFKKINEYQKLSYDEAYKIIGSITAQKSIEKVDLFLTGDCPRNLSSAWLKKNESKIRKDHPELLEKMYNFVFQCEPVAEHEEMYLKQALYFYYTGEIEKAKIAIERALLISNNETMRILYWAGVILENNTYLQEVIEYYPYSFHAIEAGKKIGKEVFKTLLERDDYSQDKIESEFIQIVKTLIYFEKYSALDKLLRLNTKNRQITNQEWFYINRLLKKFTPSQYNIWMVARLSQARPDYINNQVVQLVYEAHFKDLFIQEASKNNLNPYLLIALSKQESGFNPQAESRVKAKGLMQLMPKTAKSMDPSISIKDLNDPQKNIELGTKYFSSLYEKYGQMAPSLAAYNAGPSKVDQWMTLYKDADFLLFSDLIPYKETRSYISLIYRNLYFFEQIKQLQEISHSSQNLEP